MVIFLYGPKVHKLELSKISICDNYIAESEMISVLTSTLFIGSYLPFEFLWEQEL